MTLFLICFIGIAGLFLFLRLAAGRRRAYLPDALVLSTGSHTVGAIFVFAQVHTGGSSFILGAAFLSFASAAIFSIAVMSLTKQTDPPPSRHYFTSANTYTLALVGVILANLFIVAMIFRNPAIAALIIASFTAGEDTTLLAVRKAITASTEGYLFPGLIKLVRDLIGPIVIVSFVLSHKRASRSLLMWTAALSSIISMFVGGQRFPVVMFACALALAFYAKRAIEGRPIPIRPKQVLKILGVILSFFYIMSLLLGRTEPGSSSLGAALWSILALLERGFTTLPREAEVTFAFWSGIGPTWGLSWLADLEILLPGRNSSFSNQLHALTGGSDEGNAVLFFALDAWMAFGWGGIVFASFLFVMIFHLIDTILWRMRSPRNDAARIVMFLNIPLMYSPFLFLLYGGIVVLLIVIWTVLTRGLSRKNVSSY